LFHQKVHFESKVVTIWQLYVTEALKIICKFSRYGERCQHNVNTKKMTNLEATILGKGSQFVNCITHSYALNFTTFCLFSKYLQ